MPRDMYTRLVADSKNMNNPLVRQALEWMLRLRDINHFDPEVLNYPTTSLMVAYVKQERKPIIYVPIQECYMIDALGINPEASPEDVASALGQITKTVHWETLRAGRGEFYFPCSDLSTIGFADKHMYMRMQYTEVTAPAQPKSTQENPVPLPRVNPITEVKDIPFFKMKV